MEKLELRELRELDNYDLVNIIELANHDLVNILQNCQHEFVKGRGLDSNQCFKCHWYSSKSKRVKRKNCYEEGCITCVEKMSELKITENNLVRENLDSHRLISNSTETKVLQLEERINKLEIRMNKIEKQKKIITEEEEFMSTSFRGRMCNEDKRISIIKF